MSETAGGCVYDGRPLDGVEARVTDNGRLALCGPMLMSGYRLRPDLTATALVDGWLVTNDLGSVATDGSVSVAGRADDVIVSGGENVVAGEVAAALGTHSAVVDVAVVGVADEKWGQRVVAIIETAMPAPSIEELREWCRPLLPAAALPRGVVAVDSLPRLASGKVDRAAVARLAEAGLAG
jgi:O-succinylbenzoic acid--CoA ligase